MRISLLNFIFLFLGILVVSNVNGQQVPDDLNASFSPTPDYSYNVQQENSALDGTLASTELTANASQNGIIMTLDASGKVSLETSSDPISTKIIGLNGDGRKIMLSSSANDIRKLVLLMRSDGNARTSTTEVNYGTSSSSSLTKISQSIGNNGANGTGVGDLPSPGKYYSFDLPAGTRYIEINREAGARTVRIYRVVASSTSFTLPLDFLSFTAKPDAFGKTVALNWSTTNEINTKNFEIQKRTDDADFTTIGKLDSKNTAGTHNYSFTDLNATPGNSYYRIIQFDNNGASTTSKTQAVANKASVNISIYPNPTTGMLNINHGTAQASVNAKVINTAGKTVLQRSLSATDTKLDVSQLNPGSYLLVLESKDQKSSFKFVKQ